MKKDFLKWHTLKSRIDKKSSSPLFTEREIWWCSIGANIGAEEDGKHNLFERPVLVIRKFNREIFLGLPLTSREKSGRYYEQIFSHILKKNSMVILSQIRVFSAKRLIRKMGKLGKTQTRKIMQAMGNIFW